MKWIWAFLSIKQPHFIPTFFSPFWGENFWVGPGKKHLSPTIYFSSSPPNQTHSKKKFPSHFISKVFLSPYFASKKTHLKGTRQHVFKREIIAKEKDSIPQGLPANSLLHHSPPPNHSVTFIIISSLTIILLT